MRQNGGCSHFCFIIQFTALFEVYMWIQLYRVCLRYNSTRTVSFTGNGLLPVKKKTVFVRNKHNFKTCTHYTNSSFFRKWLLKRKQVLSTNRTRFENSCKSVVIVKGVKHDAKLEKYKSSHLYFKYISKQRSYLKKRIFII